MDTRESVGSLAFFATLNDAQIDQLVSISSLKSYKSGSILYYENSQTDRLFFLVNGLAKAYKIDKYDNEIFLYYVRGNSILSDISTVSGDTLISYSNITLAEDSKILSLDYCKFKECFLDNNVLVMELANEIIKQSKQMQSLIDREFLLNSVAKVSMLLSSDLETFNKLKRYDVSAMLHLQPETLSRVLNRLKRNGIIDIVRGHVTILDIKKLTMKYKESEDE